MTELTSTEPAEDDDAQADEPVEPDAEHEPDADDDDEAEAAEHDGQDDDEPDETEQPTNDAKAQRDAQKAVERMFDSFKREHDRHTKRVAEIAGDSAPDLLLCPMCAPDEGQPAIAGWLLPVKPSDEKIANVRAAIGLPPKIDYRDDPYSKACPTCGGLRSVVPSGMDAAALTLPCVTCKAQGWVAVGPERGGMQANGATPPGSEPGSVPLPTLEPDPPEVAALKAQGFTVIAPYSPAGA